MAADNKSKREFDTGAVRDSGDGKGRFDALPFWSLWELAKHFETGSKKYELNNWRKGVPLSAYFDSALRHLAKVAMGWTDERHDVAALWNIACYIETARRIATGDLPISLKDFPYVDMDPASDAGTEAPWTPPTDEEVDAYIQNLNVMHGSVGDKESEDLDDWEGSDIPEHFDDAPEEAPASMPGFDQDYVRKVRAPLESHQTGNPACDDPCEDWRDTFVCTSCDKTGPYAPDWPYNITRGPLNGCLHNPRCNHNNGSLGLGDK